MPHREKYVVKYKSSYLVNVFLTQFRKKLPYLCNVKSWQIVFNQNKISEH